MNCEHEREKESGWWIVKGKLKGSIEGNCVKELRDNCERRRQIMDRATKTAAVPDLMRSPPIS